MRLFWLLLVLAACTPAVLPACDHPVTTTGTDVVCVIDGDTIRLANADKVRLIGMDTPERGQKGYMEATLALVELLNNTGVVLDKDVSDEDRFGRKLRYVWADGVFVNLVLVEQGWAVAKDYAPDTSQSGTLHKAEFEARQRQVGLWEK